MVLIEGQSASQGVTIGKLISYIRKNQDIIMKTDLHCDKEIERFEAKRQEASDYFLTLAEKYRKELGSAEADIFDAYVEFVCDEIFISYVVNKIKDDRTSAEYAVYQAGEYFANELSNTKDEIISSRASDIRDVAGHILHKLRSDNDNELVNFINEKTKDKKDRYILLTDDISISEMFQINKCNIDGIVLKNGAVNGHMAILARSMGIPVICGVGDNISEIYSDCAGCLDGDNGKLYINPDEGTLNEYTKRAEELSRKASVIQEMKGLSDETVDGKVIRLCCNVSDPLEIEEVIGNDGNGIGLFRSEYLFLSSSDYPSEEIQFEIYKKIAEDMNGKRVVIRTLDISDDKKLSFYSSDSNSNYQNTTGNIRTFYEYPEILKSQLRAIYRASAFGNIAVMFPMITSVWEILECKKICDEVMDELKREHVIYNKDIEIGAMIETPAAVMIAEELAKYVDFFSVGTNDLTQYTLAVERNNCRNDRFYDIHHPAVLREIKMASDAAHKNGIRIGICGELASDEDMIETFIAMGIDELSVNPNSVLQLRAKIRSIVASECNLDKLGC